MSDFNQWMAEFHDLQTSWLNVFDFPGHVKGSAADTVIFVDIAGGIGHQCALLRNFHPQVPGRVVLQDQKIVVEKALPTEGVENQAFDLWAEQPLKGESCPPDTCSSTYCR